MANPFGDFGKVAGQGGGATPIKQAPQAPPISGGFGDPRRQQAAPSISAAPGGNMAGPQGASGLDEFGRNTAGFAAGVKNPLAAVGDFNQRKANAAGMMQPPPQAGPGTGGGFMSPGPPQQAEPYSPQGGFGAGSGQGLPAQPGQMQPPPGYHQMLQDPGFMQWIMRMFQQQRGQGPMMGQAPGAPPQPQAQFSTAPQGPPR